MQSKSIDWFLYDSNFSNDLVFMIWNEVWSSLDFFESDAVLEAVTESVP